MGTTPSAELPYRRLRRDNCIAIVEKTGRARTDTLREDEIDSEPLRMRAHVQPNHEVCWGGDDIEAALRERANAGQVILGFKILEPMAEGKLKVWDWSGF